MEHLIAIHVIVQNLPMQNQNRLTFWKNKCLAWASSYLFLLTLSLQSYIMCVSARYHIASKNEPHTSLEICWSKQSHILCSLWDNSWIILWTWAIPQKTKNMPITLLLQSRRLLSLVGLQSPTIVSHLVTMVI